MNWGLNTFAGWVLLPLALGGGPAAARVALPAAKGLCDPSPIPVEPGPQATSTELSRLGQAFTLTIWRFGCEDNGSFVVFTVDPDPGSAPFVCSASLVVAQDGQADPRFKLVEDPLGTAGSQCGDVTAPTSFALVPRSTSRSSIDLQQALVVTWNFGDSIRTLQVPAFDPDAVDPGPGPGPGPEDLANEAGVTGIFFDPMSPGQGFNFNFGDSGLTIFFYGQTANGNRLWLISETAELDLQYGTAVELDLFEVIGGTFGLPVDELQPWGTLTLTLDSCDQGQALLEGLDGIQTLNLVRLSGVLGTSCDGGSGQ